VLFAPGWPEIDQRLMGTYTSSDSPGRKKCLFYRLGCLFRQLDEGNDIGIRFAMVFGTPQRGST
jgi:hypothetical protein